MRRTASHRDTASGKPAGPFAVIRSIRPADAILFLIVAACIVVDFIGYAMLIGGDQ